ncbi:MAG: ComEC/Rec2 family competence protein [Bacteroidales bacterium]|nr:ComEC/Rec2 family competence protein [Bacteroidales bacterium]
MENRLPLKLSLPFVAGVACGALLVRSGPIPSWLTALPSWPAAFPSWPAPTGHLPLAALLLVAVCLGLLVRSRRSERVLIPLLLFAVGMFCYCSRAADLYHAAWTSRLTGLAARLGQLIDGVPFAHDSTAPLLRALMTGDRSGLDRQTVELFRLSGAAHLLALSGLHLGVIATMLRRVLAVLGNSRPAWIVRAALTVGFCAVYTIACGASPSLVRALLFIILGQVAALCPGRRSSPTSRLCVAATIQLALDPLSIRSVAFQLSYLAMVGVVVIAPRLEAWYPATRLSSRIDPLRAVWKAASLALSCQLTTAPVVWLRFGYLPQYFLLTNLFAMPLCELLLPVAILTIVLGLPDVLVRLTDLLATGMLQILEVIASL